MNQRGVWALIVAALVGAGCAGDGGALQEGTGESCMQCHNGSPDHGYGGPGIENPHPFAPADNLLCTTCHGGNGGADSKETSHVPPPPEIGDREFQRTNQEAYFNRLTLTGVDKLPDYLAGGQTWSALDYLQFVNPGDLRVVSRGESCGACHGGHAECVNGSLLATEAGLLSGALFAAGVDGVVPESQGLYQDTAADRAFRAVDDPDFSLATAPFGAVARLLEFPVVSTRNDPAPEALHNNPAYDVANVADDRHPDGRLISGSELASLYHEQVAFTCGDCHLGSAGANNRAGDFRSSGCTACHMPYSLGGRAGTSDPNVNKVEPLDPDDIDEPERAHVRTHRIVSVSRPAPSGGVTPGIDDYACAGCHQGSNRTVMQYWGIRLDQNRDVQRGQQYPAQPASYQTTHNDPRLFDPELGNHTFNGRNAGQYLRFEDYDGDGRDDTPADVHYEAGLGCIDCHGSHDLHGGDPTSGDVDLLSRMEQGVAIRCESCHGGVDAYAPTVSDVTYAGDPAQVAVDAAGNPLRHVVREGDGNYYLTSRLTGARHFVPQTLDTTVDTGRVHPSSGDPLYSAQASYAMGRDDGDSATGLGPQQTGLPHAGFAHTDRMDCASCHASWTNTCMGCHLEGEYNTGNNFSNITGKRIVFREKEADFVYQSPVFFQLGVDASGKVTQVSSNTKMFFLWEDRNNDRSERMAFSDRRGVGANPAAGHPSLSHNALMAHSIRGKVSPANEGPRYCVACHLTTEGLANFGTEYDDFRTKLAGGDWANLDWGLLTDHVGKNPGNQLNSPLWVHHVAGLGSGLFLFDEHGAPVNPLDDDPNRKGAEGVAPSAAFDPARVYFNLDRLVLESGLATGSSNHALEPLGVAGGLRDGAADPTMAGPLGASLLQLLADPGAGLVLDSWVDADGQPGGDAGTLLGGN